MAKKFKEVTSDESIMIRGINIAIRRAAGNLETIAEKLLPLLNDAKTIPEYPKVAKAIENYRKAIIEMIRHEESGHIY